MKPAVKYGIVGVGGFGGTRRERLRKSEAFEIIGGVDVRPEAFTKAEEEEGKKLKRYESVEQLVADPQIEAVFVSTPAHLHVEQALVAARAGKAVFCEKPLGHDVATCRELVEYCEKHNVPHGHGFSGRYSPLWQHVKKMLEAGTLGKIVSVSAATMHAGGLAFNQDNWRFAAGRNPGGPLFQCGIHKIDLLLFLFGEGKWTAGHVNRSVTASPTDDAYILLGTFGGVPATFHSHYVAAYRHAMEIYGTKGDLFINEYPDRLLYKATDLTAGFEPVYDIMEKVPRTNAELEFLCDFAAAVRERRQPKMNGREGLQAMELIFDAIRVSQEVK